VSFGDLGLGALAAYVLAMLGVAELARRIRRGDTPSDHFLAGRDLGVFVLFLTLYATTYSGNSLVGYPGKAYRSDFSFIMSTGFMVSIVVVFHVLVPRLRPLAQVRGFVTPGDWVRHRFCRTADEGPAGEASPATPSLSARVLVWCVGVLMSLALMNFLLAQLKAMGLVTSQVTGNAISYEWGIVGMAGLILFYETRGGMRAVAWTDAAQGILMFFGLGTLLLWLLGEAGGLGAISRTVAQVRPQAVAVPDAAECARWFSTIALLGLASVVYPQSIQRIYAAKSGKALRQSFALMSFMPFATTLVVTLIGIAAITKLDLASDFKTDSVLPLLLGEWAAGGGLGMLGAVVVFLGALSAIMSTADSCLLSLGSLLVRDLLGRSGTDPASTRLGKLLAAALLLAMIPLALQREVTLWRLIELKMELLIQCVPAFLLALHWRRLQAGPTLVGLLAGTLFAVGLTLMGMPRLWGVHVGVVGLGLNLGLAVLGSLWVTPAAFVPPGPRRCLDPGL
jgi:SSS family solute:Na+ symporter